MKHQSFRLVIDDLVMISVGRTSKAREMKKQIGDKKFNHKNLSKRIENNQTADKQKSISNVDKH
jgi:hypothetical protein